jgi:hypothetical protein
VVPITTENSGNELGATPMASPASAARPKDIGDATATRSSHPAKSIM